MTTILKILVVCGLCGIGLALCLDGDLLGGAAGIMAGGTCANMFKFNSED